MNKMIFLQTGNFADDFKFSYELSNEIVFGFIGQYIWYITALFLVLYLYTSIAYYVLAKRTGEKHAWLSWIPLIGKPILMSKTSKKHWWPVLFLLSIFLFYINIFWAILSLVLMTIGTVHYFIWRWKTLEEVGRPGWWVLLLLIPVLGLIIFAVLLGVASWGNKENKMLVKSKNKIHKAPKN